MILDLDRNQARHIIYALELVEKQTLERFKAEGKRESPCDECPAIINILRRAIGAGEYSGWFVTTQ